MDDDLNYLLDLIAAEYLRRELLRRAAQEAIRLIS
jgi:hypothetical protein